MKETLPEEEVEEAEAETETEDSAEEDGMKKGRKEQEATGGQILEAGVVGTLAGTRADCGVWKQPCATSL